MAETLSGLVIVGAPSEPGEPYGFEDGAHVDLSLQSRGSVVNGVRTVRELLLLAASVSGYQSVLYSKLRMYASHGTGGWMAMLSPALSSEPVNAPGASG